MYYGTTKHQRVEVSCAICGENKTDIHDHEHSRTVRSDVEQWRLGTSFDAVVCSETCRKTILMRLKAQGWCPYFEAEEEAPGMWGPKYVVSLLGPGADIDRPTPDEPLARVVQY